MCRWFAYISPTEECLLEDVLVTPAHSLSNQVHEHYLPKLLSHNPAVHAEHTTEAEITTRNRLFNVDGFGVAYYTAALSTFSASSKDSTLYPALYKCIQPPLHDSNFRSLAANTSSPVVFAHIRAATATAITPTNNHPFTFGVLTIMHNGFVADFAKIKRKMCDLMTQDAYEHIQGGTDTEHFAALFMSFLCPENTDSNVENKERQDAELPQGWKMHYPVQRLRDTLEKTISTLNSIQAQVLGRNAQPNDLNIAITDGASMVAIRYRNHATEQPPSLYYSSTAGVTLNRKFPGHPDNLNDGGDKQTEDHGKHVIIASEPSTYKEKEWTLIEKNHGVLVDHAGQFEVIKFNC